MAKAINTQLLRNKGKIVRISPVEMEDIVPTLDCFIKGPLVWKGPVDGGAQVCIMIKPNMTCLGLCVQETPEV